MKAGMGLQKNPGLHVPPQTGKAGSPQRGNDVLVVVTVNVVVTDVLVVVATQRGGKHGSVLVVVPLHEAMHPAGAPSLDTLNVTASFGFGVTVAVPPQYSSPVPTVRLVP
jgi:hypothetical protein